MATTNESREVKDDKEIEIEFPKIEVGQRRVLLIYMADANMHSNKLKEYIEEFLLAQQKTGQISNIEAYFNTSFYFQINANLSKTTLRNLNIAFKSHIAIFKKQHVGKIFWTFNLIGSYEEAGKADSGIIGLGDDTYHKEFNKKINS